MLARLNLKFLVSIHTQGKWTWEYTLERRRLARDFFKLGVIGIWMEDKTKK